MALYCVQCTMKAMIEGRPAPVFDHTIEEHIKLHHPNLEATQRERRELEDKLSKLYPER